MKKYIETAFRYQSGLCQNFIHENLTFVRLENEQKSKIYLFKPKSQVFKPQSNSPLISKFQISVSS